MRDAPAYEQFLSTVRDLDAVWAVPQSEIARWWEQRQSSVARIERRDGESVSIVASDPRCALEVDGQLRTEVYDCAAGNGRLLSYEPLESDESWGRELLCHLGYGHFQPSQEDALLSRAALKPLLDALRESANVHQRLDESSLGALRDQLKRAHVRAGLPDFRIWNWPLSEGAVPYRAALSVRYDVDKAIVNLPMIHRIEAKYGVRSTAYVRPMGLFYGRREIRRYAPAAIEAGHEIALHGEFVTTAESEFQNEEAAAREEKLRLESMLGIPVGGVCMHGGELRSNTTPRTRDAIEAAAYEYETMYRNRYFLPLHLPTSDGIRRTLSIGQHVSDISTAPGADFARELKARLDEHMRRAYDAGGVLVPVLHPVYFSLAHYLAYPENVGRLAAFVPKFIALTLKMKRGQAYTNVGGST